MTNFKCSEAKSHFGCPRMFFNLFTKSIMSQTKVMKSLSPTIMELKAKKWNSKQKKSIIDYFDGPPFQKKKKLWTQKILLSLCANYSTGWNFKVGKKFWNKKWKKAKTKFRRFQKKIKDCSLLAPPQCPWSKMYRVFARQKTVELFARMLQA